jgi:hypothetical protein
MDVCKPLADGLYKPLTYMCAKMFDEMCLLSMVSLVLAGIVFACVDLSGSFWAGAYTRPLFGSP